MLKTPEITEEQGGGSPSGTAGQDFGEGEQNVQSVQTRVKDRFLGHEGEFTPSKGASGSGQNVETPIRAQERRTIDARRIDDVSGEGDSRDTRANDLGGWSYTTHLRGPVHGGAGGSGPRTIDSKSYLPFAAGFSNMANEASIYRSTRLHGINPTAAVTEDISYYYTLDSGRTPPAAVAANPETAAEFVRNTPRGTHGGMFRSLMKPIE